MDIGTEKPKRSPKQVGMIIGLVIVLILFLVVFVDLRVVVDTLRQTDWRLIPLAVAFLLAGNVLLSVRLRYLMNNEAPSANHLSGRQHLLHAQHPDSHPRPSHAGGSH